MENVVAFNNELSGLYDAKPPISKAKMASITKSAMRAIKFYKHVVQSVEKFILKCKPEYKVPGLYVIDSIVRQSRHQYGAEKDVFAPRFARNITETFANLFRCAPEDKSRIVRVLNLWQKNNVFAPEVIQPIFDLADPSHPIYQMQPGSGLGSGVGGGGLGSGPSGLNLADTSSTSNGLAGLDMVGGGMMGGPGQNDDKLSGMPDLSSMSHEKVRNMRQLEHMQHHHYMKRQNSSAASAACSSNKSRDMHGSCYESASVGASMSNVLKSHYHHHHNDSYKYHKSTHEIDYEIREIEDDVDDVDDDDDDDVIATGVDDNGLGDNSPPISSNLLDNNNLKQLLNDPNVLRQLQTLQNFQKFKQQEDQKHKLDLRLQEEAFEKHIQNVLKGTAGMPPGMNDSSDMNKDVEFVSEQQSIEVINLDGNDSRSPTPDRERYKRRRNSRSRSRSPRDRGGRRRRSSRSRSRSRSQQRSSNRRRSSRERDRMERNNRDKERDREHERERRKKGLPELKKEHLSVCSTTLWVGHLSKLVYQEELSDTFGEYGDIVSIDLIVPRGCAFIVMHRRQDAYKAMQALKSHKLQGRTITISWAAGKGVKSKEWKDFWDLELGVTYIPWNKLDEKTDLDSLEEGGMFDEDSMPSWIKEKLKNKDMKKTTNEVSSLQAPGPAGLLFGIDTTQPPPMAPQNPTAPPPPMMGIVPGQFSMAPPMGGPPQRMLGPPMGPINPMTGLPMPPNLVPGMPPPHMMMPPGMLPPGFPPGIGGPVGAPPGPLGMPPGAQFAPHGGPPSAVPPVLAPQNPTVNVSIASDDQMDVEMELEDAPTTPAPVPAQTQQAPNFNQPPPMFTSTPTESNGPPGPLGNELFNRDRQRSGGASRWGGRSGDDETAERWRENGAPGPVGNFNQRTAGGPMNMAPMEINMPPRPDFMNDFENRGGARGAPLPPGMGGQRNGDFFQPNMNQNRFNQPTSLMQMRIPPPAAFNQQRMGGGPGPSGGNLGPMFGPRGNPGGPPGGRQQGPGFFNPRNPFNDNQRGRGNRGPASGRGGGRGGGGGNWSDEDDDGGNNFKRRGGPPGSGNRFRDRDDSAERRGPTQRGRTSSNNRSSERELGGNNRSSERDLGGNNRSSERDLGGNKRSSERDLGGNKRSSERDLGVNYNSNRNRRGSRDDNTRNSTSSADESMSNTSNKKPSNKENEKKTATGSAGSVDTEEDWDRELQEYDTKPPGSSFKSNKQKAETEQHEEEIKSNETKVDDLMSEQPFVKPPANESNGESTATEVAAAAAVTTSLSPPTTEPVKKQTQSPACTPLYDELPPPTAQAVATTPVIAVEIPAAEPTPPPRAATPPPIIVAAESAPEAPAPIETPNIVAPAAAAAATPAEVDASA